jgi:hypothetical protein
MPNNENAKPADPSKRKLTKDVALTPEQRQKHLESTQRALEKIKGKAKKKLPDEQRRALYRKAVMQKARKLKHFSESIIMLCLAIVIGLHALPFVHVNKGQADEWGPKSGFQIALDLVTTREVEVYLNVQKSWYPGGRDKDNKEMRVVWGVHPHVFYHVDADDPTKILNRETPEGKYVKDCRFEPQRPATWVARAFVLVPIVAILLLVLYLLDYVVFMGRLLPGLSFIFGFGAVAYLMVTKVATTGTWNVFHHGYMAWWVWLLLMVPLFLIGAVSMLRSIVSQRYKRYEYRGLPVPEHLKPKASAKEGDDDGPDGGAKSDAADASVERS